MWKVVMHQKMDQEIQPHKYFISELLSPLYMRDGVQKKRKARTQQSSRLSVIYLMGSWAYGCGQQERAKEGLVAMLRMLLAMKITFRHGYNQWKSPLSSISWHWTDSDTVDIKGIFIFIPANARPSRRVSLLAH